jgi:peptidoglycan hydrolase-like protein with peptidoglycan-binding domain
MTAPDLGCDFASVDGNRFSYPVLFGRMRFAYARAAFTYGGVAFVDPTFRLLRTGAPVGSAIGAYLILGWHGVTPEQQVAKLVESIGERKPGELPVALDLEADSAASLGMTPATCLAWAERALDALIAAGFTTVVVYTSARVWIEVLGDLPSAKFAATTCWAKIPYVVNVRQPPQWERCPTQLSGPWLPRPWQGRTPGVRFLQWQGDAIGVDGASATVDLDVFLPLDMGNHGNGVAWLQDKLGVPVDDDFGPVTEQALAQWQIANGLPSTGTMDLETWRRLTA